MESTVEERGGFLVEAGQEGRVEELVGHHIGIALGDEEAAHGKNVAVVDRAAAVGGPGILAHGTVDAGEFAGDDVNAHAGTAEKKAALELFLGNGLADGEADLMIIDGLLGRKGADVGDVVALLDQMRFDGFLQFISGRIGADDKLFVHGKILLSMIRTAVLEQLNITFSL